MSKHKLQVVQQSSFPKKVIFRCANCVAVLYVDRHVMEALLTKRDDRLVGVGLTVWGECHGA